MSIYFKFDFLKSISVHTDKKTVTVIFSKKTKQKSTMFPTAFVTIFMTVLLLASSQPALGTHRSLLDRIRDEHPRWISGYTGKEKCCLFLGFFNHKKCLLKVQGFFSVCKLHNHLQKQDKYRFFHFMNFIQQSCEGKPRMTQHLTYKIMSNIQQYILIL